MMLFIKNSGEKNNYVVACASCLPAYFLFVCWIDLDSDISNQEKNT